MSHNITVEGGKSVRLPTAGKYCDRDIVVTAEGVALPELTNPGAAEDLMKGKELLDSQGKVVSGAFTLDSELTAQDSLISQIRTVLQGKAAGGSGGGGSNDDLPGGYRRADYIRFTGKQVVDTGIICNQHTKIQTYFTRASSTQEYLYGVASSDNTASVTAYLGGSWRFGNKAATKTVGTTNEKVGYAAYADASTISVSNNVVAISGVNDFETVGSLLIGSCRSANGAVGAAQFDGTISFFAMWAGDEQVLKLVPVVNADGTYRFWDAVNKVFHDSITDTPLEGGNL
jgi:hypothetical protein